MTTTAPQRVTRYRGVVLCPTDPSHGQLLPWSSSRIYTWYCAHADHAGRPKTHPKGELEQSLPFFRDQDLDL